MFEEEQIEKIQIQEASRRKVLFADQDAAAIYAGGRLLFFDPQGNKIADVALRPEPRCLFRLNDTEFLISCGGFLWNYNLFTHHLKKEFAFASGMVSPLAFCVYERLGVKEVVFGDYGGHDEEGRVGIYLRKHHEYKKLGSFPGHRIDHVHRVSYDPFRDCFWVFTGDSFSEQNYLYEIGIETKRLRKVYRMPGPCLSGTQIYHNQEEVFCFSTSVRDDGVPGRQKDAFRRPGLGVTDRFSHIILGSPDRDFHEIGRNKGRFGSHKFPEQNLADEIVFVPIRCRFKNGHTFRVRWEKESLSE